MISSSRDRTAGSAACDVALRTARLSDLPAIEALQRLSLQSLGPDSYSEREVESLLRFMPTIEEWLVRDGTYLVAHVDDRLVGCCVTSCLPQSSPCFCMRRG